MRVLATLASALALALTVQAGSIHLTGDDFEENVLNGEAWMVKFYAPWCGHCKRLAPAWKELGEAVESTDGLNVGQVDCTQHRDVCSQNGVRGYPTVKLFKDGDKEGEAYRGARSVDAMKDFLMSQKSD